MYWADVSKPSLLDVWVYRGADTASDHHLVVANYDKAEAEEGRSNS